MSPCGTSKIGQDTAVMKLSREEKVTLPAPIEQRIQVCYLNMLAPPQYYTGLMYFTSISNYSFTLRILKRIKQNLCVAYIELKSSASLAAPRVRGSPPTKTLLETSNARPCLPTKKTTLCHSERLYLDLLSKVKIKQTDIFVALAAIILLGTSFVCHTDDTSR